MCNTYIFICLFVCFLTHLFYKIANSLYSEVYDVLVDVPKVPKMFLTVSFVYANAYLKYICLCQVMYFINIKTLPFYDHFYLNMKNKLFMCRTPKGTLQQY